MTVWVIGALLVAALAGSPCVPSGMPPYAAWQLVSAVPVVLLDEDGRPILALSAAYAVAPQRIATLWVEDLLGLVDPKPDDASVSAWIDPGVVQPGGRADTELVLRRSPRRQTCRWERASQLDRPRT